MKHILTNPIFRWIAVLPGALLAAVAATFPWHWAVLFYGTLVGEENLGLGTLYRIVGPETVERLGYGFIVPFVIITIAAKIAPKYKLATGKVVALLVVAFLIYGSFMVPQYELVGYFQATSGWDKLYPFVLVTLWIAGIYTALRQLA